MEKLNEIERGQVCQTAIQSFYGATDNLSSFPGLLKKIILCRAWEKRITKGKVIELPSLRSLITSKPLDGWGEDPKKIEAVIRDDPEVLTLYREAMKQQGNNQHTSKGDNITEAKTEKGTSRAYTLSRLQRESPELFDAVCAGELSANAAAVKAGFRHKTATVRVDNADAIARTLRKHCSKDILDQLKSKLE